MIKTEIKIKPLSINIAWQGRRFKTLEYKKFIEAVLFLLPKKKTVEGKIAIELEFYVKYPLKCDVDNFIKPLLDILVKKSYIKDDRYVYSLIAIKVKSKVEKIKITIKNYGSI